MREIYFKGVLSCLTLLSVAGLTSGYLPTDFYSNGNGIKDDSYCIFTQYDLQSIFEILRASSDFLERVIVRTPTTPWHLPAPPPDPWIRPDMRLPISSDSLGKCTESLIEIHSEISVITEELNLLRYQGRNATNIPQKLQKLESDNRKLSQKLHNLIQKIDPHEYVTKTHFTQNLQRFETAVKSLISSLKVNDPTENSYSSKLNLIVHHLQNNAVSNAITEINYFFGHNRPMAGQMIRDAIKQVYCFHCIHSWGTLIRFIDSLPQWPETLQGYQQLLQQMQPLTNQNADILFKFAYKIKKDLLRNNGWSYWEQKHLKDAFPKTIKDLMWHKNCLIRNKQTGHYMKVVTEDVHGTTKYYMGGEWCVCNKAWWKFTPYQAHFPDGPITFRVENEGASRFLNDYDLVDFHTFYGEADSSDAKWEVKLPNNRIYYPNHNSEVLLYAPRIRKYLYESKRSQEPWRCGFNQWMDCAVVSSQENQILYDEGKWFLECNE